VRKKLAENQVNLSGKREELNEPKTNSTIK
jgi:hypothetical protein